MIKHLILQEIWKPALEETKAVLSTSDDKEVFQVQKKSRSYETKFNFACKKCGYDSHETGFDSCPANGKKCNICGKYNHFARWCSERTGEHSKS